MYAKFYGLRAEPFLLTPDQSFFFESSVHSAALAYLNYGITRGEGFIVITGEIGAGKTTLVRRLCASIDQRKILAAHVVTTLVSGSDLLRMVAAAFGLVNDLRTEKSTVLLRLQSFFDQANRKEKRVLLLVDEAQNLTASALEELRMLSNFQNGNSAPFQSFLIGQPQFRMVLASPELEQLRERVIASYHLGPMDARECGEYLLHRLRHVGWKEDPIFEESAIEAIYAHSGGVPRRINTLCSRLMLFGYLEELHRFNKDDVERVADDIAREIQFAPATGANISNGAEGVPHAVDTGIEARVAGIEQRFSRREESLRRAAAALLLSSVSNDPK
jgi:putative secretion ATPase (PEP-CTERM system associated)